MISFAGWFAAAVFTSFVFVIAFGAPYLPTHRRRAETALDLLDLQPGQLLLELGSGDGRLLQAAARRGIRSIGYELNPLLVWYSRFRCRHYRHLVTIRLANFWSVSLPPADGIYVFLLDRYMARLNKKIIQEIPNSVKLVSYAFQIPGRAAAAEKQGLFLYRYRSRPVL